MAKLKSQDTGKDVYEFINSFAVTDQKKADSYELIELMEGVTGHKARMWGPTIIGFGTYHYKYASGHEGDAPMLGFSLRKSAFSLYVYTGLEEHKHLLQGLGNFTMGKACIYVKKLSDIDKQKLTQLMKESIQYLRTKYTVQ